MGILSEQEVLAQSNAAMSQWVERWKEHARINGEKYRFDGRGFKDLAGIGINKLAIAVGMGTSLEDHIETLKKYQSKKGVDILTCDKGLGELLSRGIKPKYVFVADAVVNYEQWCQPFLEQTANITLIAAITCNPKWTTNWKGPVYFYVNKDNIQSDQLFAQISGCNEMIPASSNVGNSTIVFASQVLGYKEYCLIGYDFSWSVNRNYYAFNDNIKRYWMKTLDGFGIDGQIIYTSANLFFSCRWLEDYYNGPIKYNAVKMFNCCGMGILNIPQHDLIKRLEKFEYVELTNENIQRIKLMRAINIPVQNMQQIEEIHKSKEILGITVLAGEREFVV